MYIQAGIRFGRRNVLIETSLRSFSAPISMLAKAVRESETVPSTRSAPARPSLIDVLLNFLQMLCSVCLQQSLTLQKLFCDLLDGLGDGCAIGFHLCNLLLQHDAHIGR